MRRRELDNTGVDEHTLLLLHGEDFIDSIEKKSPSYNGGVVISNNGYFKKAFQFSDNQSKSGLSYTYNFAPSSIFTVDFWAKLTTDDTSSCGRILFIGDSNGSFESRIYKGKLNIVRAYISEIGYYTLPYDYKNYCHYAFIGDGTYIKIYQNGSLVVSVKSSYFNNNSSIYIGCHYTSNDNTRENWIGYIDEFRISDIARWTENFTPPTKPY